MLCEIRLLCISWDLGRKPCPDRLVAVQQQHKQQHPLVNLLLKHLQAMFPVFTLVFCTCHTCPPKPRPQISRTNARSAPLRDSVCCKNINQPCPVAH